MALEKAKRLPERCVSGRWGSVSSTERRLLECGPQQLKTVFHTVLNKLINDDDDGVPLPDGETADMRAEGQEHYRKQMGRWRRDVHQALVDDSDLVFTVINAMNEARAPLLHLLLFLQKGRKADDFAERAEHGGMLALLVSGKAAEIAAEFCAVMATEQPDAPQGHPEHDDYALAGFSTLAILNNAAGFHRRITEPLSRYIYIYIYI